MQPPFPPLLLYKAYSMDNTKQKQLWETFLTSSQQRWIEHLKAAHFFISSAFVDNPARMQLILQIGSHKSAHAGASIGREMLQENMAIQGSDAKEEKEDLKCADKSLTQWWAQQEVALINIGHGAPLSSDFSSSHFQKQKISKLFGMMHKCIVRQSSDDGQTVPPNNKKSHSLKKRTNPPPPIKKAPPAHMQQVY